MQSLAVHRERDGPGAPSGSLASGPTATEQTSPHDLLYSTSERPSRVSVTTVDPRSRTRKKRETMSPQDRAVLMTAFDQTSRPDEEVFLKLEKLVDLSKRHIEVWFYRQRRKLGQTRPRRSRRLIEQDQSNGATSPPNASSAEGFQPSSPVVEDRSDRALAVQQPFESPSISAQALPSTTMLPPRPPASDTTPYHAEEEIASDLYRHVTGFLLSPTRLDYSESLRPDSPKPVLITSFRVSRREYERIPKQVDVEDFRALEEDSELYRIRCALMPAAGFKSEETWVTADTIWPDCDSVYVELNGWRRKFQGGRISSIEVSPYVREGENDLTIYLAGRSKDPRCAVYVVSVERVGVTSHTSLVQNLQVIGPSESLEVITASLCSRIALRMHASGDAWDFVTPTLTIRLSDPLYSDRIFRIPVRGSDCLHRQCFDLETFLSQCERRRPGHPAAVDCWRCPICRADIRPPKLVVDGFLVEVRSRLEEENRLGVEAILVESDGSWRETPIEDGALEVIEPW